MCHYCTYRPEKDNYRRICANVYTFRKSVLILAGYS
jgi:hypothetical protein